jgi:hypothetical protein
MRECQVYFLTFERTSESRSGNLLWAAYYFSNYIAPGNLEGPSLFCYAVSYL